MNHTDSVPVLIILLFWLVCAASIYAGFRFDNACDRIKEMHEKMFKEDEEEQP
jgi:hypothetical protein